MKLDVNAPKSGKQCPDDLIKSLCDDLVCIKKCRHPIWRLGVWASLAAAYLAISIGFIGLRPDIASKMQDSMFVFELFLIFAIIIKAATSAVWLCIPDMREQKWILSVTFTLLATFIVWTLLRAGLETFSVPHYWHKCYIGALIFGVVPAIVIFLATIRAKTTHPFMLAAMNTIAIGGVGYMGLRLVCLTDNIGHICIFHILPYILFAFVASLVGRRIYRW